jgi:uncharacterized protein YaaR (DUF327 family)
MKILRTKNINLTLPLLLLCFLIGMSGRAYAGGPGAIELMQPVPGTSTIPCPPGCLSAAEFTDGINKVINGLNGIIDMVGKNSAGSTANASSIVENATAGLQLNKIQSLMGYYVTSGIQTGSPFLETPRASGTQSFNNRANEATEKVQAAAESLINTMTLSVVRHYEGMSHEEALKEFVDEMIDEGYVPASVHGKFASKDSFSLIAKAFAQSGNATEPIAQGDSGKGWPSNCKGLSGQKMGVYLPGKNLPKAQKRCQRRVDSAIAIYIAGHQNPLLDNPFGEASAHNDSLVTTFLADQATRAEPLRGSFAKLIGNATFEDPKATETIDPASFFISKAYANTSTDDVDGDAQKLEQAEQDAGTAHHKVKQLVGVNKPSPLQCACAVVNALANNTNKHAQNIGSGAVEARAVMHDIQHGGETATMCQWRQTF